MRYEEECSCSSLRVVSGVLAAAIGPYLLHSQTESKVLMNELKLISARHPEPYSISIYEVENTSAGPILKENLVYTKQQAESTLIV